MAHTKRTPPQVGIAAVRAISGLTPAQVCEAVGITRGALSAIERGHRGPSVQIVTALEDVYGLPTGSIVLDYEPVDRGEQ